MPAKLIPIDLSDTSPADNTITVGALLAGDGLREYDWFTVDATLTGATGDTLDIYLQRSPDNGSTWIDWLHFPQLAAAASAISHTIDSGSIETGPVTVGTGTSVALAAGAFSCRHPGTSVRVLFVGGATTSAGAAQVITLTGWQAR